MSSKLTHIIKVSLSDTDLAKLNNETINEKILLSVNINENTVLEIDRNYTLDDTSEDESE